MFYSDVFAQSYIILITFILDWKSRLLLTLQNMEFTLWEFMQW